MKTVQKHNYSLTPKHDLCQESFFGKNITDPYRWLEQHYSHRTHQFISYQMKQTQQFLSCCPYQEDFRNYLQSLCNFDWYSYSLIRGANYFYCFKPLHLKTIVLEVIQYRMKCPQVILDPTCIGLEQLERIMAFNISDCGTYLCYEIWNHHNDQYKLYFKNLKMDIQLSDCIKLPNKSSMTWSKDNKGLYYIHCIPLHSMEDQMNNLIENYIVSINYHKLGEMNQTNDLVVWSCEMPEKNLMFCELDETGRYILVTLLNDQGSQNKLIFGYVNHERVKIKGRLKMLPIVDEFDAKYKFIGSTSTEFYIMTNLSAPFNKIIKVNIKDPDWSNWEDLIPHNPLRKLEYATCIDRKYLALSCIENVRLFRKSQPMELNDKEYDIKQVFYQSKDSTTIPMFIFHRKNITLNGRNPCKLSTFGGFGYINQPYYSASELLFVEKFNGIYALANIRGGGEFGEEWHKSGSDVYKSTAIDDLLAAAEYLIQQKYTNPDNLILQGNENGGLLAASCANKKPNLFKAIILDNPLTDMLRYYKYSSTGRWMSEYGNLYYENVFNELFSYSPVHNVPNLSMTKSYYPSVLILSDLQTANVEYIHSLKLLATLQNELHNNGCTFEQTNITLGWFKTEGQHKIDKVTSICSFIQMILSIDWRKKHS
ncbi:Actin- protein 3 [Schistosoma haematobium]|uniref:Prolyl endopeptidase n=1 Tax=Schistosoma haematobium TaxID=6185 RepID=A0A922IHW6_SCHHA|nr:Actin- protein 3 [Schistosoma haematobium]KAH9579158.1 Actin- protein 3 [Schistosoma haematobium]